MIFSLIRTRILVLLVELNSFEKLNLSIKMKRALLPSLLAVVITALVGINGLHAQVRFGINGGLNFTGLKASDVVVKPGANQFDFTNIRRARIGFVSEIPINRWFYFQPELYYSQKGAIHNADSSSDVIDQVLFVGYQTKTKSVDNIDLGYIEIPLLAKFSFQVTNPDAMYPFENSAKPLFVDFLIGPYIGYALTAKSSYSATTTITNSTNTEIQPDTAYKFRRSGNITNAGKIDFGLTFGMQLKWKVSRKTYLYLDGRYSLGFGNINKGYFDYYVPDGPTKQKKVEPKISNAGTISVSVGILTHFWKRRYWNNK